jgi:glycosyltransferase involved in cell wall biosynthesis
MRNRPVAIISNFRGLNQAITPGEAVSHEFLGNEGGANEALHFVRKCFRADLVILGDYQQKLLLACMLRPFLRFKLVSVDLILRRPRTLKGNLSRIVKKILFSQVDRFILYFKDIRGYEHLFGIKSDRVVYVPFKVNGWERASLWPEKDADGDYVLCAGRTLRDVRTFVEAMRKIDYPGVLLQQQPELLSQHGTSAWSGKLPVNVQLLVDSGDRMESFVDFIHRARLVVIPRFKGDIAATGISTYLVAMALRKCVIISEGPGAEDLLTDEAVVVPPEDVDGLAHQIELLWKDDERRRRIASQGRQYAEQLGGEKRLLSDILHASIQGLLR